MDEWVRRCQQGDLAAFDALFSRYQDRVYRLAWAVLRDERDAEDAMQEVFLRIFERIGTYRGEARFETWLYRVAVNVCRNQLRRRRLVERWERLAAWAGQALGQAAAVPDASPGSASWAERQDLWELVARLDEAHRLVVVLRYHEGFSCGEVAELLGVPVSTVYSRLNTARSRLREMRRQQLVQSIGQPGRGRC